MIQPLLPFFSLLLFVLQLLFLLQVRSEFVYASSSSSSSFSHRGDKSKFVGSVIVVGGGPVGLATALQLSSPPHCMCWNKRATRRPSAGMIQRVPISTISILEDWHVSTSFPRSCPSYSPEVRSREDSGILLLCQRTRPFSFQSRNPQGSQELTVASSPLLLGGFLDMPWCIYYSRVAWNRNEIDKGSSKRS